MPIATRNQFNSDPQIGYVYHKNKNKKSRLVRILIRFTIVVCIHNNLNTLLLVRRC